MAIGTDEAAVQADIGGVDGRHRLQLGGGEVGLGDAVLVVQALEYLHLHAVAVIIVAQRTAAQQDVQRLAGDGLAQGLLALLRAQMGQQVGDHQLGLITLADADIRHGAVTQDHGAAQLQRNGDPLVLADAAVVMGLEVGQLAVLIQGGGLQVQTGRVDVSGGDLGALRQAAAADDGQHQTLAAVAGVDLIAGGQGHAALVLHEAMLLRQSDGGAGAEALRLAGVQERLVDGAVCLHLLQIRRAQHIVAVAVILQQLLLQGLQFFTHDLLPPQIYVVISDRLFLQTPAARRRRSSARPYSGRGRTRRASGPAPAGGHSPPKYRRGP